MAIEKSIGHNVAGGICQDVGEQGEKVRHINRQAGIKRICSCPVQGIGKSGVVIKASLVNEIRVGGRVKRRNRGNIHSIRHDERTGTFGIEVGNGLKMISKRYIHRISPRVHAGTAVKCRIK
jgi:hypothetical protein